MDSLGALLLLLCSGVIICEPGRGRRPWPNPPMSQTNDTVFTVGEVYEHDTKMLSGNNIYLPLRNEQTGVLHKFEAFFMSTEPVYLQVWRPSSENSYKLIHQFRMQSDAANVNKTFSSDRTSSFWCPVVHENDRFGIFSLGEKTSIPVVSADQSSIPVREQHSEVDNEEALTFRTVSFAYKFSLKLYIYQGMKGNRAGTRFASCPEDISAATSTKGRKMPPQSPGITETRVGGRSRQSSAVPGTSKGVQSTLRSSAATTTTDTTTTTTTTDTTTTGTTTTTARRDFGRETSMGRLKSTVGRVNLSKSIPNRTTMMPEVQSKSLNVLTITVVVLTAITVVTLTVVVVLCTRRKWERRRHQRLSNKTSQDSSSGSAPGHVETPNTPNPAYGISLDFLNSYSSLRDGGEYESVNTRYRPIVPARPSRPERMTHVGERPPVTTGTTPGAATGHTYLEVVYGDADSGVGGSVSGSRPGSMSGSRPPSGVSESGP